MRKVHHKVREERCKTTETIWVKIEVERERFQAAQWFSSARMSNTAIESHCTGCNLQFGSFIFTRIISAALLRLMSDFPFVLINFNLPLSFSQFARPMKRQSHWPSAQPLGRRFSSQHFHSFKSERVWNRVHSAS